MAGYKTYIQQLHFNGITYTQGSVVELLNKFKVVAMDFPFKKNPKPKDLPTRDWAGSDGLDVYVPDQIPMNSYDIDVTFLYVGTDGTIRTDLINFIDFLYGRSKADSNDTVQSGRLAVYNEYTGIGRKDVVVSEIDNEVFDADASDPDAVAKFKVKFTVYDPTTDVSVIESQGTVTGLNF